MPDSGRACHRNWHLKPSARFSTPMFAPATRGCSGHARKGHSTTKRIRMIKHPAWRISHDLELDSGLGRDLSTNFGSKGTDNGLNGFRSTHRERLNRAHSRIVDHPLVRSASRALDG